MKYWGAVFLIILLLAACATSPLGRRQLRLFPPGEMVAMGAVAFDKLKAETPQSRDPRVNRYVHCVVKAITDARPGLQGQAAWEVAVFEQDSANAVALPGGKIGVYTGMLKVAANQNQLATVISHEIAHVLADHPNERISTVYATQMGLQQIVEVLGGATSPGQRQTDRSV